MDINDIKINGLAYDSRKVKAGDVFVAIPGVKVDGHDFIPQAIKNGATTIVMSNDKYPRPNEGINYILVENTRQALAELSARFCGYPSKKLKLIGITGTNGKTTIAYLIESILSQAGFKTGLIGTVETRIAGKSIESNLTTPESLELQGLLAQMLKAGVTHVVMEVSSHALTQYRVYGCEFDVVIYTNLTHDHLDFHKSMEQYLAEKKKLFTMLKPSGIAIVNADDPYSNEIVSAVETEVVFYGIKEAKHELRSAKYSEADLRLKEVHTELSEMRVKIDALEIRTPLIGDYNVSNILAAFQCGLAFNLSREAIKKGIEKACVPGRLERIANKQGFEVFVDFAHTPDALEKLLKTLRPFAKGKLIVVFGCPGDRDREKRPVMGKIAAELADIVIVTTDDPHTEDPRAIIDDILKGTPEPSFPLPEGEGCPERQARDRVRVSQYADRKQAIEEALKMAQKGDIVAIAGRGHEKYQDFNGRKVPIDDREAVREILGRA